MTKQETAAISQPFISSSHAQPLAGLSDPEADFPPGMIAAAALVLEHQFECSPGTAAIVAEDVLRAALLAKSEEQRNEEVDDRVGENK
jgi:hypothetical protein